MSFNCFISSSDLQDHRASIPLYPSKSICFSRPRLLAHDIAKKICEILLGRGFRAKMAGIKGGVGVGIVRG